MAHGNEKPVAPFLLNREGGEKGKRQESILLKTLDPLVERKAQNFQFCIVSIFLI